MSVISFKMWVEGYALMSTPSSSSNSGSSAIISIDAKFLKTLNRETELNGYELYPHFLVKIFNIANVNSAVKKLLLEEGFYSARRSGRLDIIESETFFNLLSQEDKEALLSVKVLDKIKTSIQDPREEDIDFIENISSQFKDMKDYLTRKGFYELYDQRPFPFERLKPIIKDKEFQEIISSYNNPYVLYLQHVRSGFVKDETSTGVCIELNRVDGLHRQSKEDDEAEGHWKIHLGIDMEKNGQENVDLAYNIVLAQMQKYQLSSLKIAAPYVNVNSMHGKEFTLYLKKQMIINISGSEENVRKFIEETEHALLANNIVPRSERDLANKAIAVCHGSEARENSCR